MDIAEKMIIERECERLVTLYCHYVDHGKAAKIAELFTEDGIWKSPEITMTGHNQIRAGFQHRQDKKERMSRHVCNNLLVDIVSEKEATGTVYVTLYRHDGKEGRSFSPLDGPEMVGEYRDHYLKTEDGWLITSRKVFISFLKVSEKE
ncbi:MAG: nuclear transport factor 2 family protein [Deltaproteobacteria bacterium]|nr:nuclear transport factor 2 family protein [Deltaproteobacteria bacterium]